jgi:hypothetical protein
MKKQLLLGATALTMLSPTQAATLVNVDFDFGVTSAVTIADVAVTGLSATDGDASYTFDLLLNGTLDNGADNLRVAANGDQCIIFNGVGTGTNSTGSVAFSLTNVVETTATGKSLVLDGITGGLFSNFHLDTKKFIADRTYTGGTANDGTGTDSQLRIAFDALTSSNLISANGTANFRMHDVDIQVSAVPEPSSTLLLGLGGISLILRRRK